MTLGRCGEVGLVGFSPKASMSESSAGRIQVVDPESGAIDISGASERRDRGREFNVGSNECMSAFNEKAESSVKFGFGFEIGRTNALDGVGSSGLDSTWLHRRGLLA